MEQLIIQLREHIIKEKLPLFGNKVLCAVSGGMDSVAMVYLLRELGIEIEIAHANFKLRGDESERDELFVKSLANDFNIKFHVRSFETQFYADQQKVSVQVAARELRYSWFSDLMKKDLSLKFTCTAHHADDNVETLLINFFKGTGMHGLKGIPLLHGNIIRPLLFASRNDIHEYVVQKGISFIEDSSNFTTKYTRNFFRLKVLPLISEIYPDVSSNLRDNLIRFREAELLYKEAVHRKLKKLLFNNADGSISIPIEKLRLTDPLHTIVYEIFSQWGFQSAQVSEIIKLMDRQSGKLMYSKSHQILKNRNWFIVTPLECPSSTLFAMESVNDKIQFEKGTLECEKISFVKDLAKGDNKIIIDADDITFPLIIRKWKAGDYFYPLGMKKKKKISRFLIDQKLSMNEKEKVWVLESNKKIIWVISLRMDDRFKYRPESKSLLQFSIKN